MIFGLFWKVDKFTKIKRFYDRVPSGKFDTLTCYDICRNANALSRKLLKLGMGNYLALASVINKDMCSSNPTGRPVALEMVGRYFMKR